MQLGRNGEDLGDLVLIWHGVVQTQIDMVRLPGVPKRNFVELHKNHM